MCDLVYTTVRQPSYADTRRFFLILFVQEFYESHGRVNLSLYQAANGEQKAIESVSRV